MILKGLCLICLYATIDPDWPGIRSQRGCWLGERVSIFFCFFFFFDGYKQKSINIVKDWKDCKCVCVCVCPIFDVTNGLHSPGFLQSWAQACWRWSPHQLPITPISTTSKRLLETPKRESGMEVRAVTLNEGKNGMEIIMETVEKSALGEWNGAELWWGLQKNYKGWVRGK